MATQIRPLVGPHDRNPDAPVGLFRSISRSARALLTDEASVVEDNPDTFDWSPSADLVETDSAYQVHLDLPGVDQRSLQITLGDGVVTISGERTPPEAHVDGRIHSLERPTGRFARSFWLGTEVDAETVDAAFGNGVLHVAVRKAHVSMLRRIEVRIEP